MVCYIFKCPTCHATNSILIGTYELFFNVSECMQCGQVTHVYEKDKIFDTSEDGEKNGYNK